MITSTDTPVKERRSARRLPIVRNVRFKILNRSSRIDYGYGTTVNISSTGILFATDTFLLPGLRLEIAISWPARLNENCPLKLVAEGRVVRVGQGVVGVKVQKYAFLTGEVPTRPAH